MIHIDRRGTYSVKTDALEKYFGKSSLIPMWVADMDFETPQCVKEALQQVIDGGVYGYNVIPDNYYPTIAKWLKDVQKMQETQKIFIVFTTVRNLQRSRTLNQLISVLFLYLLISIP